MASSLSLMVVVLGVTVVTTSVASVVTSSLVVAGDVADVLAVAIVTVDALVTVVLVGAIDFSVVTISSLANDHNYYIIQCALFGYIVYCIVGFFEILKFCDFHRFDRFMKFKPLKITNYCIAGNFDGFDA